MSTTILLPTFIVTLTPWYTREKGRSNLIEYEYDDSYRLTGLAKIKPGTLIANATTTVPADGLNEPTYDPLKNTWYGISDEAYRKLYNIPASEPDGSAKLINALTQQVFQLTQKVNQLEKSDQND